MYQYGLSTILYSILSYSRLQLPVPVHLLTEHHIHQEELGIPQLHSGDLLNKI